MHARANMQACELRNAPVFSVIDDVSSTANVFVTVSAVIDVACNTLTRTNVKLLHKYCPLDKPSVRPVDVSVSVLLVSIVNADAPASTPSTFSSTPTTVYVAGSCKNVTSLIVNWPVPSPDSTVVVVFENVPSATDTGNTDSVAVDVSRIKSNMYSARPGSDSTACPAEYAQFDTYNDRTRFERSGPTE